jgi:hypothetical protein
MFICCFFLPVSTALGIFSNLEFISTISNIHFYNKLNLSNPNRQYGNLIIQKMSGSRCQRRPKVGAGTIASRVVWITWHDHVGADVPLDHIL